MASESNKAPVEVIWESAEGALRTRGINAYGMKELELIVHNRQLLEGAESLLRYVAEYVGHSGRVIKTGETMAYGYWLLKFVDGVDAHVNVWEYDRDATEFVPGADLAIGYWLDQHAVCEQYGADFVPPRPDQLAAIDEGVFQGLPVQGVRYPSPEHMSGWWITTDAYGGVESLKTHHMYHVTARRPDIAKYVALPFGFALDLRELEREHVWYDPEVAASEP